MAAGLKLSVIVPVGPGEHAWQALLPDLSPLGVDTEVLLVAAYGEAPAEFDPARFGLEMPVRWLVSATGRARQQNAGAAAARGETLWFLHADSRVPAASLDAARRFSGRAALGYFDLGFRDDGPWLVRLNALGAWIRSRWFGLPFGDQGLILSRHDFERLGGFDEALAAGEDHALVWTARRAGIPLAPLGAPLSTSARRYAERGWLKTTLRNARLTLGQARAFSAGRRPRS